MRTQVIACVIVAATAIISGSGDSVLADPQEKPAVPHAPRAFDAASVKRNISGARQRSYALSAMLDLPADATRAQLLDAMKDIIAAKSADVGR